MTALVLDSGAFIAVENGDRTVIAHLRNAKNADWSLRTTGAVVAEVWRSGDGRQVPVARLLGSVDVHPVDDTLGRAAGRLLGSSGLSGAVDATIVAVSQDGDTLLTSDEGDINPLVVASGRTVSVVHC